MLVKGGPWYHQCISNVILQSNAQPSTSFPHTHTCHLLYGNWGVTPSHGWWHGWWGGRLWCTYPLRCFGVWGHGAGVWKCSVTSLAGHQLPLENNANIPCHIWGLCCQKQVSQAGISNYISQFTAGCNYLSLPEIPASGNKVHICCGLWVQR